MLIVMPPLSASQRGNAIRRSSIDPIDIEMRIAAITVLQKQEEIEDKSHAATTKGSPTSFTGRVVPHFPGEDFPDPLIAVSAIESMSAPILDDYGAATHSSVCTLTPAAAGPVIEAHMMQLHAMRHYPLIDRHYFSQQECYLNKTILKWEFDVLKLEESSAQGVLKDVCLKLVELYGLIDEFSLSLVSLHQTFQLIQGSYHNNPYHNAAHAADVVQAACCLIAEQKIWKHMTMLERLAMIMAGACHDLDHPGVNQAFLKTTNHYLTEAAKKYPSASTVHSSSAEGENTSLDSKPKIGAGMTAMDESCVMSVLEIHHIRHAVAIFDQTQVFAHFSDDAYLELLRLIRELILATDMAFQGRYMEKLKRLNKEFNSLETDQDRNAFFACEETRRFYLQISLKCADICNTCRPWEVSQKWSRRVTEEFFSQGDKERVLSLPINEINDRTRTTIEKVQVGFLKFVARPLFAEWSNMHNSDLSLSLIKNIDDNLANWSFVQNKHLEISSKAATAAPVINLKEGSTKYSSSVDASRDVATVIVTPGHTEDETSREVVQMNPEPPSSIPSLPNMPSVESMLDRPHKPPDLLSDTSSVHLDQIGGGPASDPGDELSVPKHPRKRSIPCAFVSLDHSVAIIQDNLRIQSEGNGGGDDKEHGICAVGATTKVTKDSPEKGKEAKSDEEEKEDLKEGKKAGQNENEQKEEEEEFREGGLDRSDKSPDVEAKNSETVPAISKHIDSDQLDFLAVARTSSEEESSARNMDVLPQTFSSYILIKPQSEILESVPSGQTSSSSEIIPSDYEELLHKLKYSPFDSELLAEVAKMSVEGRQRLEALSRLQQQETISGGGGAEWRKSPASSKCHDSGTFSVDPTSSNAKTQPTLGPEAETGQEKRAAINDQIAEDDPDLNAYAKLTSPPPYRKSIMLTVDKSLERLRAMHAKSSKGGGEDFEGSRISYAVVYDKAKLTQVKVRGGEWESTQERKDRKKDKNKEKDNSSHPKKTTSRSETFFVPSSTSMQSEEVLIPDGSMGSATSPEYNRKKINQSRSNFFQSLLPTSRLKANVPSNSSSGDGIISGSPFPSSDGSSQNTSGSLYLSSPRNKHSGDMSESRLLTESADALCEAGQVNATSQSKNRTHTVVKFPSFPVLDHELEPNGPEEVADPSMCRQNSDMVSSGEGLTLVIQSEESNTNTNVSAGLLSSTSGTVDTERRPSRSMHPDSVSEKASKRSQSASARIAKTFQKLFTGSRPHTHRSGGAVGGGSSSSRSTAAVTSKGSVSGSFQQPQRQTSASHRMPTESSSSKGANVQLRHDKSVPSSSDCSFDLKKTKNSNCDQEQ